jgi:hypothetical protein
MKLVFLVCMSTLHTEKTVFEPKLCGNKITCLFMYPISTRPQAKVLIFIFICLFIYFYYLSQNTTSNKAMVR